MEKTYIDNSRVIEFLCETADRAVREKFGSDGLKTLKGGGTCYTEEAQDFFNEVYDCIEGDLNTILGVHSITDLEVVEN